MGILGIGKLQQMMPVFLGTVLKPDTPPHVRDGNLLVFVYLPVVFGQAFTQFIPDVIPALLIGLADDAEYVRDTSLLCGQRIVTFFADTAIELLLPELEAGMFDENWRIRYASVQLLGDLLYKIAGQSCPCQSFYLFRILTFFNCILGASGKHTTEGLEEDENFGTEQSHSVSGVGDVEQ